MVLETEGVRGHHYKLMAADFEDQRSLRPSLGKAVFHAILSFHPTEKIDDARLVEIAKEYLQKMEITDTQFSITKHTDRIGMLFIISSMPFVLFTRLHQKIM